MGAAKSRKDFGIPNLAKQMKGPSPIKTRWQAYALLASMAMLGSSIILTTFSGLGWELDLSSLQQKMHQVKLQEATYAGNAERYYEYESIYQAYSYDWDTMFANLKTYNDNLVKILDEVEKTIPKDAAVVTIGIAEEGLAFQFACEDKEMAAYLIMSLRDLKYADLKDISNLTVGPRTTAQDMLPSLATMNSEGNNGEQQSGLSGFINKAGSAAAGAAADAAKDALGNSEAAPATGASDMSGLLGLMGTGGFNVNNLSEEQKQQLIQMYLSGELDQYMGEVQASPSSDQVMKVLGQAIKNGTIDDKDMFAAMDKLSPEQLDILEKSYGATPEPRYSMKKMRDRYTELKPRQRALETMLTTDDFAIYRFHKVFMEDLKRDKGDTLLYDTISDDLWKSDELFGNLLSGDVNLMKKSMPDLLEILTKNEKSVSATEDLIETDTRLAKKYAYYWCVEKGVQDKDPDAGTIDVEDLMGDILSGDLNSNENDLEDVVDVLMENLMTSDPELKDAWEEMNGGNSLEGILGDLIGEAEEEIVDTRIHFAVVLSYKPELIEAEQYHKGLPYYAKLNKVEVK